MWFTTGDNEQKAKNLEANQHCALTTGTDTLTGTDYVIEGVARLVTEVRPLLEGMLQAAD